MALLNARDSEGNRLINNASVVEYLVEGALNHYGPGGLVTGEQAASMASEKEQIKQIMNTDINKYYAEGWNKKYAAILQREERMGKLGEDSPSGSRPWTG